MEQDGEDDTHPAVDAGGGVEWWPYQEEGEEEEVDTGMEVGLLPLRGLEDGLGVVKADSTYPKKKMDRGKEAAYKVVDVDQETR
ncbi:hypothetical protein PRK78_002181 [Emydomyces testavorans]|uniref:Uncharacterized protein n=1 Tax=Emydomyces testavorans TaxID=2070801 RepID=A0AAF0DDW8_9EURO|nr:hypothetical protein PRK78_002181 [Emydomyces testavorans]